MRALLVQPRFPMTYWGFQNGLRIAGKKASLPPLGMVTMAACLPDTWELRLIDRNIERLDDADLSWADVVLTGGMLIQADSMYDVIRRARAMGRRVVVGGPAPTTSPDLFGDADVVFRGELEGRAGELLAAIAAEGRVILDAPSRYPDMAEVPIPRFDLLRMGEYASMSVQYSRGCPFHCEFCDIIEIFGRVPRVKSPTQVLAELEALFASGYRGSVFFVDDNFIGNRRAVRELLPLLAEWQRDHHQPFELYTEASANLATDPALVRAMVAAGFTAVFVGLETPSTGALEQAGKRQNLALALEDAVDVLTRGGLEVMAGFIVGFDQDCPDIFEAQRRFVAASPIPLAMIGLLSALPGTALWRRLDREGRLRDRPTGDQFGSTNFEPSMDEDTLLAGYAKLLRDVYSPDAYVARCTRYLARCDATALAGSTGPFDVSVLARALWRLGVVGSWRLPFWKLLAAALPRGGRAFRWAVAHAVMGEHLVRYTTDEVLPRLAAARLEVKKASTIRRRQPPPSHKPASVVSTHSSPPLRSTTVVA